MIDGIISTGIILKLLSSITEKPLSAEAKERALSEGIYHITTGKNAERIMEDGVIKKSNFLTSYSGVLGEIKKGIKRFLHEEDSKGLPIESIINPTTAIAKIDKDIIKEGIKEDIDKSKRTFFFIGKPEISKIVTNISKEKMSDSGNKITAVHIQGKTVESLIDDMTYRTYDGAGMYKGNLENEEMEVKEFAIALDKKNRFYLKEGYTEEDLANSEKITNRIKQMSFFERVAMGYGMFRSREEDQVKQEVSSVDIERQELQEGSNIINADIEADADIVQNSEIITSEEQITENDVL